MTLMLMDVTETIPLHTDEHGVIRIVGSRITLDTIVTAHKRGDSPEVIVEGFSTLKLSDVYRVIGYYLDHQGEVEAYLAERQAQAEMIRQKIESDPKNIEFRSKLKERIEKRKAEK